MLMKFCAGSRLFQVKRTVQNTGKREELRAELDNHLGLELWSLEL